MLKIITPQLAEAGKIKIGKLGDARRTRGGKEWRPPVKLDHFIITSTRRDPSGDLHVDETLMAALVDGGHADPDGKVRSIPIVLHSDDIDEIFPTNLALYAGKALACSGDGETAKRYNFDKATRKRLPTFKECACPCPYYTNPQNDHQKCKPHGDLRCSIILPGHGVAGSVYRWRTTSAISINRMVGSLRQIQELTGSLRGLPLLLRLSEVETTHGQPVYVCHVELRESVIEARRLLIEEAKSRAAIREMMNGGAVQPALALPPDTAEEEAAFAEEFHPEALEAEIVETVEEASLSGPESVQAVAEALERAGFTATKKTGNSKLAAALADGEDF